MLDNNYPNYRAPQEVPITTMDCGDEWGDEEEDMLFCQASQIAEAQIQAEAEEFKKSSMTVMKQGGESSKANISSSHSVPVAIRRYELASQNVDQFDREDGKLAEAIKKYEAEIQKLKQEKMYAKGEVDNLRRRLELEDEKNQSKLMDELNRRNEEKQIQKQLDSLKSQIQVKDCEIIELKQKLQSRRDANASFTASQSPSQLMSTSIRRDKPTKQLTQASTSKVGSINAIKFFEATENKDAWNKSRVNAVPLKTENEASSSGLSEANTAKQSEESSSELSLPAVLQKIQDSKKLARKPRDEQTKEKSKRRNHSTESSSSVDSSPQLSPSIHHKNPIVRLIPQSKDTGELPSWKSLEEKLCKDDLTDVSEILRTISYRVECSWPMIKKVIETASKEIIKTCDTKAGLKDRSVSFPEVMDFMFEWGVDLERKKIRDSMVNGQEEETKTVPALPKKDSRVDFLPQQVDGELASIYEFMGPVKTLMEVSRRLKKILLSIEKAAKFSLYEENKLVLFHRLLVWASELWKRLPLKSQLPESSNGNVRENYDLKEWTGLALKIDWRDYFVRDLEVEIRQICLSILERVARHGHFEQKQSRYMVLYSIIEDTLSKEYHCTVANVINILQLLTWSVFQKHILDYLCRSSREGPCLARLLGENVLSLFKKSNLTSQLQLYNNYMYLVEILSRSSESESFLSYASKVDNSSTPLEPLGDEDMACTQYASTQRFAAFRRMSMTDDESNTGIDEDNNATSSDSSDWLDPCNWEVGYTNGNKPLCSCRKILTGNVVHMMKILFQSWLDEAVTFQHTKSNWKVDTNHTKEEIQRLRHILSHCLRQLSPDAPKLDDNSVKHIENLKQFARKRLRQHVSLLKSKQMEEGTKVSTIDSSDSLDVTPVSNDSPMEVEVNEELGFLKRDVWMLDVCIERGLLFIHLILTRGDNLVAAIGSEAYIEFMVMTPLVRLHLKDMSSFSSRLQGILQELTSCFDLDSKRSQSLESKNSHHSNQVKTDVEFVRESLKIKLSEADINFEGDEMDTGSSRSSQSSINRSQQHNKRKLPAWDKVLDSFKRIDT